MRDRILAVIQGQELDQVPFILYEDIFPTPDLVSVLGENSFGLMRWSEVHQVYHPHCHFVDNDYWINDVRWRRTTLHTPVGSIFEERAFEPVLNSSSVRKHFLESAADYSVLWAYLEDSQPLPNYNRYHQDQADLGIMGLPLVALERTPYQQLWIIWAGLDQLSYHFADFPDIVHHTIELLSRRLDQLIEIAANSPAPFIDFPDNITADAIGLRRFEQYCVPFYNRAAERFADSGKKVFVHMDGNLKPLWGAIARSHVAGLDSFSPAPDNDTSVSEAVSLWPEKSLFINFPSSVHLLPADEIYAMAADILAAAGHTGRLQMQISENVPPFTWKTSLPAILRAIRDFGRP